MYRITAKGEWVIERMRELDPEAYAAPIPWTSEMRGRRGKVFLQAIAEWDAQAPIVNNLGKADQLIEQLKALGAYTPFDCDYCRERDMLVTGPHSHICSQCGGHAIWGVYLTPLCDPCHTRLGPRSHLGEADA